MEMTQKEYDELIEELIRKGYIVDKHIYTSKICDDYNVLLDFFAILYNNEINIFEDIDKIPDRMFIASTSLETISIPSKIKEIGEKAFYNCDNLESVELPDSIEIIGDSAFGWDRKLKDINLPNNLKYIGKEAFRDCINLKYIFIPKSVEKIETGAFNSCYDLTIYCEAEEKPKGWSRLWNSISTRDDEQLKVVWGVKKH